MQILGKLAVVTGGARGIGKRIAEVLADKGARVVVGDVLETGSKVADEINAARGQKVAVFEQCDLSKTANVQALMARAQKEFGVPDIVINNAGVGGSFLWADPDSESLSRIIDINLKAPIEATRLAVGGFLATQRNGSVVNVSSIAAIEPLEISPVYAAAKAGLVNFTAACASLAKGTPSIHVNAVCPVFVDTAIVRDNVPNEVNAILRSYGELSVDDVVAQVIRCIEDESLAGDTIRMRANDQSTLHDGVKAGSLGFVEMLKTHATMAFNAQQEKQSPLQQPPEATSAQL
ncbi:hypothetical protein H4R20_001132 [Coemansia guatemalensis]|uniref:Uncharacterized protein n=1 Tax=Coemansia guatemalensis TaxID=2761395 RepID=A0A9W8I4Y4_9FUNG|nr:hypothetical protein H4R20_001132 [Coemansia guatemalensis]